MNRRSFFLRLLAAAPAVSLAQPGGVGCTAPKPMIAKDLSYDVFDGNIEYGFGVVPTKVEGELMFFEETEYETEPGHFLKREQLRRIQQARKSLRSYHLSQTGA